MAIFIKNIPNDTHLSDLYHFVEPTLKRRFPFKSAQIAKTEIVSFLDKSTHLTENHGIVHIEPEDEDQRVIRKLSSMRLQNKLVIVREYVSRNWHNDRRLDYPEVPAVIKNKRVADRRRGHHVEVIKDTAMSWQ
ncbi:hypothetical protein [Methylomonas sp. AM2-LC]|uniref:hypothetical protein n=1 Tax=Methylomonas sp. AM2-LC TaxID=3153301 RepID=UPI0032631176